MSGKPDVTVKQAIEKRKATEESILKTLQDFTDSTGLVLEGVDVMRDAYGRLHSIALRARMPE